MEEEEQRRRRGQCSSAGGGALFGRSSGGASIACLPAGMRNLGNTCYLNAVLQASVCCLARLALFRLAWRRNLWGHKQEPPALNNPLLCRLPPCPFHPLFAGAAEPALLHRRFEAGPEAAGSGGAAAERRRRLLGTARLCGGQGQLVWVRRFSPIAVPLASLAHSASRWRPPLPGQLSCLRLPVLSATDACLMPWHVPVPQGPGLHHAGQPEAGSGCRLLCLPGRLPAGERGQAAGCGWGQLWRGARAGGLLGDIPRLCLLASFRRFAGTQPVVSPSGAACPSHSLKHDLLVGTSLSRRPLCAGCARAVLRPLGCAAKRGAGPGGAALRAHPHPHLRDGGPCGPQLWICGGPWCLVPWRLRALGGTEGCTVGWGWPAVCVAWCRLARAVGEPGTHPSLGHNQALRPPRLPVCRCSTS